MKKYNYFYNGQAITQMQFIMNVPKNWEDYVDDFCEYSYGYYMAIEREEED